MGIFYGTRFLRKKQQHFDIDFLETIAWTKKEEKKKKKTQNRWLAQLHLDSSQK